MEVWYSRNLVLDFFIFFVLQILKKKQANKHYVPGTRFTKTIHVTFCIVVLQRHASFVYLIFDFSTLANPIIFFLYIPPYLEGSIFFLVNFFQIRKTIQHYSFLNTLTTPFVELFEVVPFPLNLALLLLNEVVPHSP